MGLYSRFVLPRLVDFVCSRSTHMRQREKVVPFAEGRVLEIGFGTGLNAGYYVPDRISKLWGLDPSPESLRLAERSISSSGIEIELLEARAESIPLESRSVDTIVVTYSLCSIGDRRAAAGEMRRVLVPGGRVLFCEHGLAPDERVRAWQRHINPVWRIFSGGCELTVDVPALLAFGGLTIERLETMYLSGFRPASYNYWGSAR